MITCAFENGGKESLRHVVVDVLVIDGNKILMVKRTGKLLESGKWALPGGFLARDETCEQGATREVKEETGYEIQIIKLLRVVDTPNRPHEDRQNVSFVYVAKPLEKTGEADKESSEMNWFDLDKLPPAGDIAFDHYDNIKIYLEVDKIK